jgi:hypothetical protein
VKIVTITDLLYSIHHHQHYFAARAERRRKVITVIAAVIFVVTVAVAFGQDAASKTLFPVRVLDEPKSAESIGSAGSANLGTAREGTRRALRIQGKDSRGGRNATERTAKLSAQFYEENTNKNKASERQVIWPILRTPTKEEKQKTLETNAQESGEVGFKNGSPQRQNNQAERMPDLPEASCPEAVTRSSPESRKSATGGMGLPKLPLKTPPAISGGEKLFYMMSNNNNERKKVTPRRP